MYIIKHDDMTRKSITEKIHNDVVNKRRSVFSTSLDQSRTKIGIVKFRAVVGDDEAETKTWSVLPKVVIIQVSISIKD